MSRRVVGRSFDATKRGIAITRSSLAAGNVTRGLFNGAGQSFIHRRAITRHTSGARSERKKLSDKQLNPIALTVRVATYTVKRLLYPRSQQMSDKRRVV